MPDAIIIGAGLGGLSCAAKLASSGKKVLVLEKMNHIGGTSYIFRRNEYIFPMGPLSFSFPNLVKKMLIDVGVTTEINFERHHFQLISPYIDIIYSQEWNDFKDKLKELFKSDEQGIETCFNNFNSLFNAIKNIQEWNPEFVIGKRRENAKKELNIHENHIKLINENNNLSSELYLSNCLKDDTLIRLLGSQGSYPPIMSMTHLAFLWNLMSNEGIWFPSCGIHGISDLLNDVIINHRGEVRLNSNVKEILLERNRVVGVKLISNEIYNANWIIVNADYKKTILNLINKKNISQDFLESVKNSKYTTSELSIYLGIDPNKVDLTKMRATHLFYRAKLDDKNIQDPEDFKNKEIEICDWSKKSYNFAPKGKKNLILRVNMPYEHFEYWKVGEKKRKEGYKEYKRSLADKLIKIVDKILPGLSSSIEVMEVATPLTYEDWGQRTHGSIAGWNRDMTKIYLKEKALIENPFEHLLNVGIYSFLEPFLGGVPTSIYSGCLAADYILEKNNN